MPPPACRPGCASKGIGIQVGDACACRWCRRRSCFDLLNGGDKEWGRYPPYRELGYEAASEAAARLRPRHCRRRARRDHRQPQGRARLGKHRHAVGYTVGALVVVNAIGSAVIGDGPHFWAAPYEEDDEFGGLGLASTRSRRRCGGSPGRAARSRRTTIALVATDAHLSKGRRSALPSRPMAGSPRRCNLSHALFDGDTVFSAATGRKRMHDPAHEVIEICAAATNCMARAIARGVYAATALPFAGALPAWADKFAGPRVS